MEHSRFFDSVNGDRQYPASSFSEYFAAIIGNGVKALDANLQVLEVPGTMKVEIQPGAAWINGYFYMVDTDKLQLTIDPADPNDLRYDRIVLRLDLQNRELKAKVLKGIPDVDPIVPELTRNDQIYEISLAKINVTAGKTTIEQLQIIDERVDDTLCGKADFLVSIAGLDPEDYGSAEDVLKNTQALSELGDAANYDANQKTISFVKQTITSTGGVASIDWRMGNKAEIILTEDVTLSFINPIAGANLALTVKQDEIGGHTLTFPSEVITPEKGQPSIGGGSSVLTFYGLYYDGSKYLTSWSMDYGIPASYVTIIE